MFGFLQTHRQPDLLSVGLCHRACVSPLTGKAGA